MRKLTIRRGFKNTLSGRRVLTARCACGWEHITAYRFSGKYAAKVYLARRYNAHPCRPKGGTDE